MEILIISDLHLGDDSRADDFGEHDTDIIEWIRNIDPDKIYLAGDLYELWQFKSQKIRNAHYLLIDYLNGRRFVHIRGNHDMQLIAPLTKSFKTKSGKRVLISHGFQNDKWMTNPLARLGIWALTWLERFIPGIDNENTYSKNRKKSRTQKKTLAYAMKMLKKYDMVFCGHTHRQMTERSCVYGVYVNVGSCIHGKFQGAVLDTLTDEITMV